MHYLRIHPAYYNDFDRDACAWLRELIRRGLIAPGDVDERSILDVSADDLHGYRQCHFFAGIGGWSYALRLAGWPDDKPVWTGSPPCQPFSSAGRQKGQDDARHLAPHFISLVGTARPPVLFGEQVASAAVFGPAPKGNRAGFEGAPPWAWLDDLSDRLEAAHYAVGASDIPAAGFAAFHERQRTFFGAIRLADRDDSGLEGWREPGSECSAERAAGQGGVAGGVADSQGSRRTDGSQIDRSSRPISSETREVIGIGDRGSLGRLADNSGVRSERSGECRGNPSAARANSEREEQRQWLRLELGAGDGLLVKRTSPPDSPWRNPDWLFCRDGKWRPVESGTFPLAHGVSARVGRLRGYGNAIVPQVAAEFIKAFTGVIEDRQSLPRPSFDPLADL